MSDYQQHTNWIWTPAWSAEDKEQARIVLFRKALTCAADVQEAAVQISADTRYKLYVNETLVEVGPTRGDLQVWFYDTVDIAPYLHAGENMLAVAVLRYPEDPSAGNHGMFRTATPGLYVAGQAVDEAGNAYDLGANASWRCVIAPEVRFCREEVVFAPLIVHEEAAGSALTHGWQSVSYDDAPWAAVEYPRGKVPEAVSPGNLHPRRIPSMYRQPRRFAGVFDLRQSVHTGDAWERFLAGEQALVIPPHSEERVVVTAGAEMTGYMHMALAEGAGAEVALLYSEAYVQDALEGPEQIPVKGDRLDKENGHLAGYRDVYHVAGLGTAGGRAEVYEPYWFRTFRFVEVTIRTGEAPLTLQALNYAETGYPLEIRTQVLTSDESHQDIWEISERTLRRCMQETYTDCPFYEQLQYIMDARSQILYTYAVSADDRLARQCLDDLRRAQRYDGLLNCCYPNCNPNVIPGFSIYYILMLHDHMMYYGDRELVADHLPVVERILRYYERHLAPEGYVGQLGTVNGQGRFWSFIDWAQEWNATSGMPPAGLSGPITMESLLYVYGLQHAAGLEEFLGRHEDAVVLRDRATMVQDALRRHCMNAEGLLQDGPGIEEYSQHGQVFGILTGTVDVETGRRNLLRTLEEPGFAQCTVAMRFYLFRALEQTGLYAYTDRCWEAWRQMLRQHCTTCVEGEFYARSECHAWGALILYELPSVTLGVRPAAPGYQRVRIAPVPGYLTHAAGTVYTPRGSIQVSWTLDEDGQMQVQYTLPAGMDPADIDCPYAV